MPALVKSRFTEAILVVFECTDAISPFEEVRGKERRQNFAQPVLTCQHDLERFNHDRNFVQVLSGPAAVLQL